MATQARQTEYVTRVRQNTIQLWDALLNLLELQPEWTAQDYGTTLVIEPEGPHAGLTPQEIGAVVFDTASAIEALMQTGHATNVTDIL